MATALELGDKGWKPYVDALRRRSESPTLTPGEQAAREKLLQQVRAAADLLKVRFGARRVLLFGSLAHEAWFSERTDVDLAVEGLEEGAYWKAWRQVEEMVANRTVDFIELESVREPLLRAIEQYGIEL